MASFDRRRLEPTRTFRQEYAAASEETKSTIDGLLRELEADSEPDNQKRLRLEDARPRTYTIVEDGVLIVYFLPADHPVIILVHVIWL